MVITAGSSSSSTTQGGGGGGGGATNNTNNKSTNLPPAANAKEECGKYHTILRTSSFILFSENELIHLPLTFYSW